MRTTLLLLIAVTVSCTSVALDGTESAVLEPVPGPGLAGWLNGVWDCDVAYLAIPGFPGSVEQGAHATWTWAVADELHASTTWVEEAKVHSVGFTEQWTFVGPETFHTLPALQSRIADDGTFVAGVGTVSRFTVHLDGGWMKPFLFSNPIYWYIDAASTIPPNGTLHGSMRVSVNRGSLQNYANFSCVLQP